MKQLSYFLTMIIILNLIAHLTCLSNTNLHTNKYTNKNQDPQYEIPFIVKPNQIGKQGVTMAASAKTMRDIVFKGGDFLGQKQSARNNITKNFSSDNLNSWLDFLEKENIKSLNNNILFSNLSDIRIMATNIQQFLNENCQRITALMNLIDLKIKEVSELDKKIIELRPDYKDKMKRIASDSSKLTKNLNNEKIKVEKIITDLKKEGVKFNNVSTKTDKVKTDLNKYAKMKVIQGKVNTKLNSYMNDNYFPNAHVNLMKTINEKYDKFTKFDLENLDVLADKIYKNEWSKSVENAKKEIKNKNKAEKENKVKKDDDDNDKKDDEDKEEDTVEETNTVVDDEQNNNKKSNDDKNTNTQNKDEDEDKQDENVENVENTSNRKEKITNFEIDEKDDLKNEEDKEDKEDEEEVLVEKNTNSKNLKKAKKWNRIN